MVCRYRRAANSIEVTTSAYALSYTSDRARCLPEGGTEFLGRVDQQAKIRGFRIELEEIETALHHHPAGVLWALRYQAEGRGKRGLA